MHCPLRRGLLKTARGCTATSNICNTRTMTPAPCCDGHCRAASLVSRVKTSIDIDPFLIFTIFGLLGLKLFRTFKTSPRFFSYLRVGTSFYLYCLFRVNQYLFFVFSFFYVSCSMLLKGVIENSLLFKDELLTPNID